MVTWSGGIALSSTTCRGRSIPSLERMRYTSRLSMMPNCDSRSLMICNQYKQLKCWKVAFLTIGRRSAA